MRIKTDNKSLRADLRWITQVRELVCKISRQIDVIEGDLRKRLECIPRIGPDQLGAPEPGSRTLTRREKLLNRLADLADEGKLRLRCRPNEKRSEAFVRRFALKNESDLREILKRHKQMERSLRATKRRR